MVWRSFPTNGQTVHRFAPQLDLFCQQHGSTSAVVLDHEIRGDQVYQWLLEPDFHHGYNASSSLDQKTTVMCPIQATPEAPETTEVTSLADAGLGLQNALPTLKHTAAVAEITPGRPTEQLHIQESETANGNIEADVVYPTGKKVWVSVAVLALVSFLNGLDLAIVAVTIPRLTDHFKTVDDIGWYSASYGVMLSAWTFFFGKLYTLFEVKPLYICGLAIFEAGSLLCTFAPTSRAFIMGRIIAGIGASCWAGGMMTIVSHCFPLEKRAMVNGLLGFTQSFGLVGAPVIGGAIIDRFTWRGCFGINVPLGAIAITAAWYAMEDPYINPDTKLPLREKFRRIDIFGTLLIVPAVVLLLIYLQWGGIRYSWSSPRMIALITVTVILFAAFITMQWRQGEKATVPPRIAKKRTVLGAALFCACCNGILAVTEYVVSIYFQGVRGYTATKAGMQGLPMLVGVSVSALSCSMGITWLGYYTPFMLATSILAPVASGLLTMIDLDDSPVKLAAFLAFLGVAIGCGIAGPFIATQTVLSPKEVSVGLAIVSFGAGIGSSLFISISSTLFRSRLVHEVNLFSPTTNGTALEFVGLSDIRKFVDPERLKNVLLGYDKAVIQTLYLPLGLAVLSLIGTAITEVKSIKKKQA